MTKKQQLELKQAYENACNMYVEVFCKKQEMYFDGWIGHIVGEMGCFGDYYLSIQDIILDIQTNQKKGLILDWHNDGVEHALNGKEGHINYASYIKWLRYKDLN